MNYTYREILTSELLERKSNNPLFSLRAFARDLELSPGHLSMLMSGKKRLTQRQASKILSKLELSPADREAFVSSLFSDLAEKEVKLPSHAHLLKEDEFSLISEWYHFAILSLGAVPSSRADSVWIAERLGLSELQARDALSRLQRLGLIVIRKDGSYRQATNKLTTTDDISSAAIKKFHKQNLELAKMKLDTVPVADREYGSITMSVNPSKMKKAKKMIREFQEKIQEELEVGRKSSVYSFSVQLFPLTVEVGATK